MGMAMSDIQAMDDSINYAEVGEKIRHLIQGDDYETLIFHLAQEEGGTPEDKIVELLEEMIEHRIENLEPEEADAF